MVREMLPVLCRGAWFEDRTLGTSTCVHPTGFRL